MTISLTPEAAKAVPLKSRTQPRRRRRTKAEWFEIVAAWKESGMSGIEYAEQHRLDFAKLRRWARRVERDKEASAVKEVRTGRNESPKLVVVGSIAQPSRSQTSPRLPGGLELELRGGHVLRIGGDVGPEFVGALLFALAEGKRC